MIQVEVATQLNADLGESPVWDVERQILHLVDILAQKIHRFNPVTRSLESLVINGTPGALALRRDGSYIAGVGLDFATISAGGLVTPIATVSAGERFNDGKCDVQGRFIAGTMNPADARTSALYSLDFEGTVTQLLADLTLSNGLDWNLAGDTMYHVDTVTETVQAFDYDPDTGRVGDRRIFIDLNDVPGRPDGLTVDAEGGVWVAMARGGTVLRYDENGRRDVVIEMPTPIVTSLAFGGRDLDRLFVTTSRALLSEPQRTRDPVAGAVFVVDGLGVQGRPANRFGG